MRATRDCQYQNLSSAFQDQVFIKKAEEYVDIAKGFLEYTSVLPYQFFLSDVLEKYDTNMQEKYIIAMYRFALVLSKENNAESITANSSPFPNKIK